MGRKPQVSKKKKMPLGSWATLLPLVLGHTPVFGFCVVRHGVTCACFNFHLFLVSGGVKVHPGSRHRACYIGCWSTTTTTTATTTSLLSEGYGRLRVEHSTKLDEPWTKFTNKEVEGRDLRRLATAALTQEIREVLGRECQEDALQAKSNGLSNGRRTLPTAQIRATMLATEFDLGSVEENQPVYSQNRSGLSSTGLSIQMSEPPSRWDPGVHGQRALSNGPKAREKRVLGQGRGKAKGQSKGNAKGGKGRGKGREQNADAMETWGAGSHASPSTLMERNHTS